MIDKYNKDNYKPFTTKDYKLFQHKKIISYTGCDNFI
jgi:hypothetical protein